MGRRPRKRLETGSTERFAGPAGRAARQATPPTFIDLFAGCGGLSLGLMNAGWTGLFAIENEPMAFSTLKKNLIEAHADHSYRWPSWLDKRPWDIGEFIDQHRDQLMALRGRVGLIAGGPPCQGYSLAGRRSRHDRRNSLFLHYIELVAIVRPHLLLIENVKGIAVEFRKGASGRRSADSRSAPYSEIIAAALNDIGYDVQAGIVHSVDCGVAQKRPRFIMAGLDRTAVRARRPDIFKIFQKERLRFLKRRGLPRDRFVGTREAISDLETKGRPLHACPDSLGHVEARYRGPQTPYQRLLHGALNGLAPNSLRLANHRPYMVRRFERILATCRKGVVLSDADRRRLRISKHTVVPLHPGRPSHTLTTLPDDLLHYSEPRILSVRECARLQSFPDWFEFSGKYVTGGRERVHECPRYTQVGNAVPPFLAEVLGLALRRLSG
jgi:DNA (cytosine-5)-methyltransferase 1